MKEFPYNPEDYNCPQEQFDPKTFCNALLKFRRAMYDVYDLMDKYGLDCQEWLGENYPFEHSFDEEWFEVTDWVDGICEYFENYIK